MAVVLPDLIDPAQGAFVKGRSISENILMAQELIRGYARKRISPRCMIMVDIRKAYDTAVLAYGNAPSPQYAGVVVKACESGAGGIMAPSLTMYLRLRGTLAHTLPGCGKGLTADLQAADKSRTTITCLLGLPSEQRHSWGATRPKVAPKEHPRAVQAFIRFRMPRDVQHRPEEQP
nr:uncharacterized protein LOC109177999 [Ipomoea trifida]